VPPRLHQSSVRPLARNPHRIDAGIKACGAVALQSSVEVTATLAEVILAGIPQGENGKFQSAHIDIFTMRDRFAERRGVIGEFAVAVGARDDKDALSSDSASAA
jgi:hypothetical protein